MSTEDPFYGFYITVERWYEGNMDENKPDHTATVYPNPTSGCFLIRTIGYALYVLRTTVEVSPGFWWDDRAPVGSSFSLHRVAKRGMHSLCWRGDFNPVPAHNYQQERHASSGRRVTWRRIRIRRRCRLPDHPSFVPENEETNCATNTEPILKPHESTPTEASPALLFQKTQDGGILVFHGALTGPSNEPPTSSSSGPAVPTSNTPANPAGSSFNSTAQPYQQYQQNAQNSSCVNSPSSGGFTDPITPNYYAGKHSHTGTQQVQEGENYQSSSYMDSPPSGRFSHPNTLTYHSGHLSHTGTGTQQVQEGENEQSSSNMGWSPPGGYAGYPSRTGAQQAQQGQGHYQDTPNSNWTTEEESLEPNEVTNFTDVYSDHPSHTGTQQAQQGQGHYQDTPNSNWTTEEGSLEPNEVTNFTDVYSDHPSHTGTQQAQQGQGHYQDTPNANWTTEEGSLEPNEVTNFTDLYSNISLEAQPEEELDLPDGLSAPTWSSSVLASVYGEEDLSLVNIFTGQGLQLTRFLPGQGIDPTLLLINFGAPFSPDQNLQAQWGQENYHFDGAAEWQPLTKHEIEELEYLRDLGRMNKLYE
ncbi:hypothetical protein BJ508DRAFT_380039 [Ascobolus immersus RN42]|uniref:Uncharacterized protein n=1 Tax=Ascobolus immersus RN42 TaxID=1160509 RepID=A0A3N4HNN2_ASCIM|nr:hypothetical protein BJ508DRAFT_380039 [Ascobolus immersus RN42]